MEHRLKSTLLVLLLLGILLVIGLIVGSEGITGGMVAKSVACENDGDCDDGVEATEDICRNPGTEFSLCVNKPIRED